MGCGGDEDASDAAPAGAGTSAAASAATAAATPARTQVGGEMILATTTSTQDSGLLDVLMPRFKEATGVDVKVIAVGTGAALEMARRGDADAVLVHAPASEKRYVDDGWLAEGKLVMHNDFVIVGPPSDPARVKGSADLNAALRAVAGAGRFISRGDNSGTHQAELGLWRAAGIEVGAVRGREEAGQGMGATLTLASEKGAYTLTDRATYLANRRNLRLDVVYEGAAPLLNIYHAYIVNPSKHSGVKAAQARAFVNFMVDPAVQAMIGDFKRAEYGQSLFVPDAGKTVESLAR